MTSPTIIEYWVQLSSGELVPAGNDWSKARRLLHRSGAKARLYDASGRKLAYNSMGDPYVPVTSKQQRMAWIRESARRWQQSTKD